MEMTDKIIIFILFEIILIQVKIFWLNISWFIVFSPILLPIIFYGSLFLCGFLISLRVAGKDGNDYEVRTYYGGPVSRSLSGSNHNNGTDGMSG